MREKFIGIVKSLSPEQSGTSKSGNDWKRKDLILYNADPKFRNTVVAFTFFNWKVKGLDDLALQVDDQVQVEYYLSANEYSGRWITNVTALSVSKLKNNIEDTCKEIFKNFDKLIEHATFFEEIYIEADNSYRIIKEIFMTLRLIAFNIQLLESDKQKLIEYLDSEIKNMAEKEENLYAEESEQRNIFRQQIMVEKEKIVYDTIVDPLPSQSKPISHNPYCDPKYMKKIIDDIDLQEQIERAEKSKPKGLNMPPAF